VVAEFEIVVQLSHGTPNTRFLSGVMLLNHTELKTKTITERIFKLGGNYDERTNCTAQMEPLKAGHH